MAEMRKLWFPILFGILLTAALFPLGVAFSKSGSETFSFIFFPYTSLLGLVLPTDTGSIAIAVGYALFFLQYPVYGVILKLALDKGKIYRRLLFLLALHVMVALVCFAAYQR